MFSLINCVKSYSCHSCAESNLPGPRHSARMGDTRHKKLLLKNVWLKKYWCKLQRFTAIAAAAESSPASTCGGTQGSKRRSTLFCKIRCQRLAYAAHETQNSYTGTGACVLQRWRAEGNAPRTLLGVWT